MSEILIYAFIAIGVALIIYFVLGKSGTGAKSYETDMNTALDLSRECIKEAQETNRLLKEIVKLLEKK